MKKVSIYLFPAIVIMALFLEGCLGNKTSSIPTPVPSGTFAGQFRLLRRKVGATKIDTIKANIQLVLTTGVGFQVLGDTATVHAGSKGRYAVSDVYSNLITFQDDTYPKTGTPAKSHLNGNYQYLYDGGSVLQMVANYADTLAYQYDLKKVN